jgi:neutral trehalase
VVDTEVSNSVQPPHFPHSLTYTVSCSFAEVYYWDSFWIMEGLLKSELYNYANDLLNNFMDLIDAYGFVPNGGRKYYLNRYVPFHHSLFSASAVRAR